MLFYGEVSVSTSKRKGRRKKNDISTVSHHNIGHGEHHQAAKNHDEHHGILEHQRDAEGLMRNEVAVSLPRDEFDGIGKLDGRWRV